MNAARQVISRKVVGMGPRLTASARSASTTASHHGVSPHDKSLMRSVFTVGTLGVSGGVAYGAARSGGRMNSRYSQKNSSLDNSKWFAESQDLNHLFGSKQ